MPKNHDLSNIVKKIGCPFNALSSDGSQCYCSYGISAGNKKIKSVCLGSIPQDIENHCGSCSFRQEKEDESKEKIKQLKINDSFCVECPLSKEDATPDSCKSCAFFNKKTLVEIAKKDESAKLDFIPCSFPFLPKDAIKVFLDKKTKESLKANPHNFF